MGKVSENTRRYSEAGEDLSAPLVEKGVVSGLEVFDEPDSGRTRHCRRPGPVRAYIDEQLPDVLEGQIEPGRVFDRVGSLDEVPDGYRLMDSREVLKFQIEL
jgi:threonine dehydrogenase-like Zn-dependent dehydrogenase